MEGVNQWAYGLMYDHANFRIRMPGPNGILATADGQVHETLAADITGAGIYFNQTEETIRFMNVPRASFRIYAFATADDLNPANALAVMTLPVLPQTVNGPNQEWAMVRVFDLTRLLLPPGSYYIRVQAVPNVMAPVRGMNPATYWGVPSLLNATGAMVPVTITTVPVPLPAPQNLRFENVNAGFFTGGQNSGIGPFVNNGSRALVWDPVQDAVGYIVYAFVYATETNPANAFRYQQIGPNGRNGVHDNWPDAATSGRPNLPHFVIGHDSVVQSRTQFQVGTPLEVPGGVNHIPVCPTTGYLSWGAMFASTRQDFDIPLPFEEFHFRVVAIAPGTNRDFDSDMSAAVAAYPGARSTAPSQSARLIEEARARGAQYPYFIFFQSGNVGMNGAGVANRLYVPFSNSPTPNPDYFSMLPFDGVTDRNLDGLANRNWVDRMIIEIQNHPAYIGPETLIFHG